MAKIPMQSLTTIGAWNHLGELSRYSYRNGYLGAAELLADAIENTEGSNVRTSSAIYPVLHLYRHFVELTLKDFIDLAIFVNYPRYNIGVISQKRKKLSHDLRDAYFMVREIISGIYDTPDLVEEADRSSLDLIEWFHKIDSKGDSFRYTLDRNSQAQLPDSLFVDLTGYGPR